MKTRTIDTVETAKNIRRMCSDAHLSVNAIQQAMNLESPQSVYRWLSSKYPTLPSLDHLVMLAMLLDCHIDDLLVVNEVSMDQETSQFTR